MFFEKLKRITPPKIKNLIKSLVRIYFRREAIKKLKNDAERCKTIYDYVNLSFSFEYKPLKSLSFNIKPNQIREEISKLLEIIEKKRPRTILEIGTANGGTLFLFSRVATDNATIISIDLPEGKFGGGYPKWKIPLYKSFATQNQKIHLLRADSHNQETLEKVKNILGNQKIDFLFIDGDHTYEGVKKDFEMYSKLTERESDISTRHSLSSFRPKLSGGEILEGNKTEIQNKRNNLFGKSDMGRNWGNFLLKNPRIIAFHDIVFGPNENVGGVPKFWREIRNNFQNQEIVKNWQQGGFGIGIIIKNESKGLNNNFCVE